MNDKKRKFHMASVNMELDDMHLYSKISSRSSLKNPKRKWLPSITLQKEKEEDGRNSPPWFSKMECAGWPKEGPPLFKMVVVTSTHTKSHWLELLLLFFFHRASWLWKREREKKTLFFRLLWEMITLRVFASMITHNSPPPWKNVQPLIFSQVGLYFLRWRKTTAQ